MVFPRNGMAFKFALLVLCSFSSVTCSFPASVSRATRPAAASFLALLSKNRPGADLKESRFLLASLKNEGRSLKATTSSEAATSRKPVNPCIWNGGAGVCERTLAATTDFLRGLTGDFAAFVSEFTACARAETQEYCNSAGNCVWHAYTKRCYFADTLSGREDSVCYEKAPGYVSLLLSRPPCLDIHNKETCLSDSHCFWDDGLKGCVVDSFKLFYGFKTEEYVNALTILLRLWREELFATFDIPNKPPLDWSSIRRWRPSQICTEDATPELCAFLSEGLVPLMPYRYYCDLQYRKHRQKTACNEDRLCQYSLKDEKCRSAKFPEPSDLLYAAQLATVDQIDAEIDRTILTKSIDCEKPKGKCKGKCVWDDEWEDCLLRESWIFSKIAAADKHGEDTLCKYIKAATDSGCLDLMTEDDCTASLACSWRLLDEECLPAVGYLTHVAAEEEDKSKSLRLLERACSKHKSLFECLFAAT